MRHAALNPGTCRTDTQNMSSCNFGSRIFASNLSQKNIQLFTNAESDIVGEKEMIGIARFFMTIYYAVRICNFHRQLPAGA